jgi:hypothetical protein
MHCHRHLTAGLCTATTRLGTATTMIVIMLFAFSRTAIASFSANGAQLSMKVGITSHKTRTKGAQVGTVAASFNALSHHLNHVAINTGIGTVFAVA